MRPFRELGIPLDALSENQLAALGQWRADAPINVRQQVNANATSTSRAGLIWCSR